MPTASPTALAAKLSLPLLIDPQQNEQPSKLVKGNRKLGDAIWHWSIPSIHTCPGRTELCEDLCYAAEGFFAYRNVQETLLRNYRFSQTFSFVDWILDQLRRQQVTTLRIHVSGDFYDSTYAWKWYTILEQTPGCPAFFFTRSWRDPTIAPVLAELARLPHVWSWFSLDQEAEFPEYLPPRVRTAYLLTENETAPRYSCDLVLRDNQHESGHVHKFIGSTLVCPVEQGVTRRHKMTCSSCRYCFSPPRNFMAAAQERKEGVTSGRTISQL